MESIIMPLFPSRNSYNPQAAAAACNFQRELTASEREARLTDHQQRAIQNTTFCIKKDSFEKGKLQSDADLARKILNVKASNITTLKDAQLFLEEKDGYLYGCLIDGLSKGAQAQTLVNGKGVFECCSRALAYSDQSEQTYDLSQCLCDTRLSALMPDYVKSLMRQVRGKSD